MKRGGMSHIEVILSFVLFIGALSTLLYFINPLNITQNSEGVLQQTIQSISKNTSIDVLQYSIVFNDSISQPIVGVSIPDVPANYHVAVVSYNGQLLSAKRDGDSVYIEWKREKLVYVRFSEDFDENLTQTALVNSGLYRIGSVESEKSISVKKLSALQESYNQDYNKVRESLNIPASVDFGFAVSISNNQEFSANRTIPRGVNVFSNVVQGQFIEQNGVTNFGGINVYVW